MLPNSSRTPSPAARGDDHKAVRCFQVRGDVRGVGCLRRRGCVLMTLVLKAIGPVPKDNMTPANLASDSR